MSFLFGYDAGYGKMVNIDGMIYAYYMAAAPSRRALVRFSLAANTVEEITFSRFDRPVQMEKPLTYIDYINDANAIHGNLGIVYYFLLVNRKLKIYRYDLDEKHWFVGDFIAKKLSNVK
jgi:hypothetical protein